jgi:hypothetical protein
LVSSSSVDCSTTACFCARRSTSLCVWFVTGIAAIARLCRAHIASILAISVAGVILGGATRAPVLGCFELAVLELAVLELGVLALGLLELPQPATASMSAMNMSVASRKCMVA